ncbi:hypothetical protein EJB05_01517, partial [Eragrostis curvula]
MARDAASPRRPAPPRLPLRRCGTLPRWPAVEESDPVPRSTSLARREGTSRGCRTALHKLAELLGEHGNAQVSDVVGLHVVIGLRHEEAWHGGQVFVRLVDVHVLSAVEHVAVPAAAPPVTAAPLVSTLQNVRLNKDFGGSVNGIITIAPVNWASTLKITFTSLINPSVCLLNIDGCPPYPSGGRSLDTNEYISSRWEVDGYDWEIRFYPTHLGDDGTYDLALELVFLGEGRGNKVTANLSCRLVDGICPPSAEKISPSKLFQHPLDSSGKFVIMKRCDADSSGYLSKNGSVSMVCTVTVCKDLEAIPMASSDLPKDLGVLLQSGDGADVTLIVSGESLSAHKIILAARSPVFKAEFFGEMKEKTSRCIEIKEMEAAVFKAMLGFIYTDTLPEPEKQETATAMAHHLLVAADRYGLEKLKVMCERRLALGIEPDTVATTLALAEQHNCSQLKAKCIEFIAATSPEILGVVMATEGFKSLEASLLTELFMAAHGRIKK